MTLLSSLALTLLAVTGCLGLLHRMVVAGLRSALAWAEGTAAAGSAEVSERRGDVTGLIEGRSVVRSHRRMRLANLAVAAGCLAVLIFAPALGIAREAYAAASLLWLLPRARIRPGRSRSPLSPS